jgi:DNA-binding SARP family transcriptional activator
MVAPPVLICLLGDFRVLKHGRAVPMRHGGKLKQLLSTITLTDHQHASRATLVESLWPGVDPRNAGQSLNTLVHGLRRLLADALSGAAPLERTEDGYRLNRSAGVEVDTLRFEACVAEADRQRRAEATAAAVAADQRAADLYGGDLCSGDAGLQLLIERERLRGLYLTVLARLTEYYHDAGEYGLALNHAQRMLLRDPCREDAHRAVMRCHARLGQRAQALNQYRLCCQILHREFDAVPEPATEELFDQLRGGLPVS